MLLSLLICTSFCFPQLLLYANSSAALQLVVLYSVNNILKVVELLKNLSQYNFILMSHSLHYGINIS